MSWRNGASQTGSNAIPLGTRRKAGLGSEDAPTNYTPSDLPQSYINEQAAKQELAAAESAKRAADTSAEEGATRKRRSRWGDESSKIAAPNVVTVLPSNLSQEKQQLYVINLRIEEISNKLRNGDYVPREKSPEPEPVYGPDGKRVNTREFRYRKKLEDERHNLVLSAQKIDPSYRPPADYKKPNKMTDKLYIPVRDFPEINFIGLLIGPRGNTLKKMETESGAKISIRGKGSVKEGKSRDGGPTPGEEEDLHCLITAESEEKVKKAMQAVERVIETAVSIPESQNDLKRNQLRELAALNGTLRDDENQVCANCGSTGHRRYDCPEGRNFTASLVCRLCGGAGHVARDCTQKSNPEFMAKANQREQQLDNEYQSLMAELGEGVRGGTPRGGAGHYGPSRGPGPRGGGSAPWASQSGSGSPMNGASNNSPLPPWARQNSSDGSGGPPRTSMNQNPYGSYGMPPPAVNDYNAAPPGMAPGYDSWSYNQAPPGMNYSNSYGSYPQVPPGMSSGYGPPPGLPADGYSGSGAPQWQPPPPPPMIGNVPPPPLPPMNQPPPPPPPPSAQPPPPPM
ncbi:hypothetical protein SeLEV6574_g02613 [Synchytrium endobioticum]|uniref:Branchpoint-bridging protein n=1 Tax=Synchytrium endobioticum TaxID=286115 RepID=A0A507D8A3_9FUNG|nr:hypothetical protein SeLEV6574_g02613 [Synchytrium endobioticum]